MQVRDSGEGSQLKHLHLVSTSLLPRALSTVLMARAATFSREKKMGQLIIIVTIVLTSCCAHLDRCLCSVFIKQQ